MMSPPPGLGYKTLATAPIPTPATGSRAPRISPRPAGPRARTSRRASADARSDGRKISEIHSANATISDNEIFRASPLLCTVLSRSWQLWSLGYSVTEKHRRFGKCGWKVFEIHSLWCSCQNTSRVWSADQPVKGNWIATVWKDLEELTFKVELWGKPARSLFKCHLHSSLLFSSMKISWKLRIFNVQRGECGEITLVHQTAPMMWPTWTIMERQSRAGAWPNL